MSKSIKKTPILPWTNSSSEKKDKRIANRKLRRINKVKILKGKEEKVLREVSDPWLMSKDGKSWTKKPKKEWLRK